MPVLPLIDALILLGWSSLLAGFLLKVVYVTTSYRPTLLGFHPIDFLWMAGIALLFAVALAARTWVKANEPALLAERRRRRLADDAYGEAYRDRDREEPAALAAPNDKAQPRRAAGL
jgi:hypothetical protein